MGTTWTNQLPERARDLAAWADELAPTFGLAPALVLGVAFAESDFGRALKPATSSGTGDFIPRPANPSRDLLMKRAALPGVVKRTLANGIPARKLKGPVAAWCPTTNGWGVGVFQIDWEAHHHWISRGLWKDPRECMAYACQVLRDARGHLRTACGLRGDELDRAMVAAYNAGAGRVAKFIREDRDLDGATFRPGYVAKILAMAEKLAGPGAWRSPPEGVA